MRAHCPQMPDGTLGVERVAVAVSGGVDSAVAALLERERGVEVIAITVKLWADPETDGTKACCSPEAVLGARAVAHSLDIPHFTLDLEADFRRRVVDRFVNGYAEGQTPNPCILCNGEVRLAAMLDLARAAGGDSSAHRALRPDRRGRARAAARGRRRRGQGPELHARGAAAGAARAARLPAHRHDQGRGPRGRRRGTASRWRRSPSRRTSASSPARASSGFLRRHGNLVDREGAVVDRTGRNLGRHRGHHNFTVGQRRGTRRLAERAGVRRRHRRRRQHGHGRHPRGHRNAPHPASATRSSTATAPGSTTSACATTRRPCRRRSAPPRRAATRRSSCELAEPFDAAAPGQTAVLMDGETIVGHGTITAAA